MKAVLSIVLLFFTVNAFAQDAPLIRFGRGFAAEEQVWLMSARPDLTPNQGKRYQLKQILFQANPERFQAYLAGELDAGTAPGLAVIFARAQGMDMKIVANVCLEAGGNYFATSYMVKDDGPIKRVSDLKGGTIGVVGIKTATDLWARAGLINAGLVPDRDTKVVPMAFPVIGDAVRTGKVSNRRLPEVERILDRDVLPAIGNMAITDLRKRDVIELVELTRPGAIAF